LIAQTAEKNGLEREIERERILLGELPELSVQILELCRERGRIKIGEASKVTEISRHPSFARATTWRKPVSFPIYN
jgi:hypothetical protein